MVYKKMSLRHIQVFYVNYEHSTPNVIIMFSPNTTSTLKTKPL